MEQNFIDSITKLLKELDELEFDSENSDSILDLLSIKKKAIEASNMLSSEEYMTKCLFELEEVSGDEIRILIEIRSEENFNSAQSELRCVLDDLISGRPN